MKGLLSQINWFRIIWFRKRLHYQNDFFFVNQFLGKFWPWIILRWEVETWPTSCLCKSKQQPIMIHDFGVISNCLVALDARRGLQVGTVDASSGRMKKRIVSA